MPAWGEVLKEIQQVNVDVVRRKYLRELANKTERCTIAYYSGWLSKPSPQPVPAFVINDEDKNAFMATVHKQDRSRGLDLILHTPGGDLAAAESLVDYLRRMFKTNIRVIVPQLAMSAGTMIACSAKEILMGKQSNLGPIDPQINGISAHGVVEEFRKAIAEVGQNPNAIPIWNAIIGKYHPSFLGDCEKALKWSEKIVRDWLITGMLRHRRDKTALASKIAKALADHQATFNHSRHLDIDYCRKCGLKILSLEKDDTLQDLVLTVHHAYMHTFNMTNALKIVENDQGVAFMKLQPQPPAPSPVPFKLHLGVPTPAAPPAQAPAHKAPPAAP